jgi:VWFA-related protein
MSPSPWLPSRATALWILVAVCATAEQPSFKAGISMVEVDTQVIGPGGVIEGLTLADFVVKENRQPMAIRECVQEETPLDVVMLFDLSKIMESKRSEMILAAELAMTQLRAGDRVAVMSFNQRATVEQALTGDLSEMKRRLRLGLDQAVFSGKPFVLPAAEQSADYLAGLPEPHQRRVVLMFTGDAGWGLEQNHSAAAGHFWQAEAVLSAVVIPNPLTRFTHVDNPDQMWWLMQHFNLFDMVDDVAERSGGEVIYLGNAGPIVRNATPVAALRQMIENLRKRYKLYYDRPPGKAGQRRQIEIELSDSARLGHPDARIIGRKGYIMPH